MSTSYELPEVARFTAGTVGPPGARVFYLQAAGAGEIVTLKVEKAQVAALADYLAELLSDLQPPEPVDVPADLDLVPPVEAAWAVGSLGLSYDERYDRVVLVAEELVDAEAVEEPATARLAITRGQVRAFVDHAAGLVAAGRPPCQLCGRPLDPRGHVCVKTNGHGH